MTETTTNKRSSNQEQSPQDQEGQERDGQRIRVRTGEERSSEAATGQSVRRRDAAEDQAQGAPSHGAVAGGEGREMPFREKRQLQQEEGTRAGLYFEPPVDIYETEDSLTLVADLPGVAPENIDVDLRENMLTITAQAQPVEEHWRPLYQEYRIGHYHRQFRVGQQIDQARISARMKDGVLTLNLPKVESALPRRIQVQAS